MDSSVKKGFVHLINNQIRLWAPPNKYLKNKKIYNSIRLKNGGFAIGTISNGVLFLTKEGEIEYEFSLTNGLINNTVLSLFEDNRGKIWLGLDDGINSIDINSQIKVFKDTEGSIGSVYASIVFAAKPFSTLSMSKKKLRYTPTINDKYTFLKSHLLTDPSAYFVLFSNFFHNSCCNGGTHIS